MTGITFLLDRHIKQRSLSGTIATEGLDAFEAVGPWVLTLFCLAVMGASVHWMTRTPPILFYLMLTYATALSLIVSAPLHTLLNRYLADQVFTANFQAIVDNLMGLSVLVAALTFSAAAGLVFCVSQIPFHLKVGFVAQSTLFSLLWCAGSIMCSLKQERLLLFLYLAGVGLTLTVFAATRQTRTADLVLMFSTGIAVPTAGSYAYILKAYLRERIALRSDFLRRSGAVKLAAGMLCFNLGFWIDKFIFWFSARTGRAADPLFHYYAEYDFPFFIALTTMMLGSVLAYRGIKRKITAPYEAFVFKLTHNFPFRELALEKYRLFHGISQVSSSILLFYGGTAAFILFLVYIGVISLPWRNPFVFHYLLTGTIFFSLYFFYFLVLQYLDDYGAILRLNALFLIVNAAGTGLSVAAGLKYYGTGFMIAAMVCALASFAMVNTRVGGLEFKVFMDALRQAPLKETGDETLSQNDG